MGLDGQGVGLCSTLSTSGPVPMSCVLPGPGADQPGAEGQAEHGGGELGEQGGRPDGEEEL